VTEAEGSAGVTEAQDMLFLYNILKSLGLKVQLLRFPHQFELCGHAYQVITGLPMWACQCVLGHQVEFLGK
jgi:hypothetical protein